MLLSDWHAICSRPSAALICVISLRARFDRRGPRHSDRSWDLGYVPRHSESHPASQCRNQHDHDHPSGQDLSPLVSREREPPDALEIAPAPPGAEVKERRPDVMRRLVPGRIDIVASRGLRWRADKEVKGERSKSHETKAIRGGVRWTSPSKRRALQPVCRRAINLRPLALLVGGVDDGHK